MNPFPLLSTKVMQTPTYSSARVNALVCGGFLFPILATVETTGFVVPGSHKAQPSPGDPDSKSGTSGRCPYRAPPGSCPASSYLTGTAHGSSQHWQRAPALLPAARRHLPCPMETGCPVSPIRRPQDFSIYGTVSALGCTFSLGAELLLASAFPLYFGVRFNPH